MAIIDESINNEMNKINEHRKSAEALKNEQLQNKAVREKDINELRTVITTIDANQVIKLKEINEFRI
jgi:hypothetical protein